VTSRPGTVAVVAGFLFAATVIAAVVGAVLLFPGSRLDWIWELNPQAKAAFRAIGRVSGALLWILAAGCFAGAMGLLRGQPWAWWFAVALFAVNACGDIVGLVVTGDVLRSALGVAVSCGFLLALAQPRVRQHFGRRR